MVWAEQDIVIMNGLVYDLTDFKSTHPGGPQLLEPWIGKDITEEYENNEHSEIADRMAKHYIIGKYDNGKQVSYESDTEDTVTSSKVGEAQDGEEFVFDYEKGSIWQVYKKMNIKQYMYFINDPKHLAKG